MSRRLNGRPDFADKEPLKPFHKNNQAEKNPLIITPALGVRRAELPRRCQTQKPKDVSAFVFKCIGHRASECVAEPTIDDVRCEATFPPGHNGFKQESPAYALVQPLSHSITNLQLGWQSLSIFNNIFVEEWTSQLQAVRH